MRKVEHERIMRETRKRWEADKAKAVAYWEAEAQRIAEIADQYAQDLDRLDGIIIKQTAALQVIRLDPKIAQWLKDNDPKALAQVTEAVDAAPDWQIDNARPDYMAEGTKAREAALAAHAARRERLEDQWDPKDLAAKIVASPKPEAALVTELEELVGKPNMSQKVKALCYAYAEAKKAAEEAAG